MVQDPSERAAPVRHGILDPVGRHQPDEGEDCDDHHVVLPRRALEGPEEGIPQHAGGKRRTRHIAAACSSSLRTRYVRMTRSATEKIDSTRMTQSTPAMRFVNAPIMKSTIRSGRSMNPTLHLAISDSARARV